MEAVLVTVNNELQTKTKLPSWIGDDPDKIINDVKNGITRVITSLDAENCKKDLEKNNGAVVQLR